MEPKRLSRELREAESPHLDRRRRIAGLLLGASGSMALISAYQLGLLSHIPEPPLRLLDADRVDASEEAYARLETPDAVLGLGSYALTLGLAAAGGADRSRTRPWLPLALSAKLTADAVQAARLTWMQWSRHRRFCSWCLGAAGATFAALPLAVPEALDALRSLVGRRAER